MHMVKSATSKHKKTTKKHSSWWKLPLKILAWIVGIAIFIAASIWVAFQVSPWPSALLIRDAFNKGAAQQIAIMDKYVPKSGVHASTNISYYNGGGHDTTLDVYTPDSAIAGKKNLPTVVWVHGGGWVSGDKANVAPYLKILSDKGYTTVGVNYTIAPEKQYPTPVLQVNEALKYLNAHAAELNIDPNRIFLAGDSAGSQIAAQVATLITNPTYQNLVGMTPPLKASQISGMVLTCGAYDLSIINTDDGTQGAELLETFLWSYSGYKNFTKDSKIYPASVVDHVTSQFPPTFITAGNADPLLKQSQVMTKKLQSLNVEVEPLFYPADYSPALQHEYQFDLDLDASQKALQQIIDFLGKHSTS